MGPPCGRPTPAPPVPCPGVARAAVEAAGLTRIGVRLELGGGGGGEGDRSVGGRCVQAAVRLLIRVPAASHRPGRKATAVGRQAAGGVGGPDGVAEKRVIDPSH